MSFITVKPDVPNVTHVIGILTFLSVTQLILARKITRLLRIHTNVLCIYYKESRYKTKLFI